jgi:hypothetical protein
MAERANDRISRVQQDYFTEEEIEVLRAGMIQMHEQARNTRALRATGVHPRILAARIAKAKAEAEA